MPDGLTTPLLHLSALLRPQLGSLAMMLLLAFVLIGLLAERREQL